MPSSHMLPSEPQALCDAADQYDPSGYAELCEEDLDPATFAQRLKALLPLAPSTPQPVVLVSSELGIYLGECMGLGFWSLLDPAGQDAAVTFPNEAAAREHVSTWQDQPQDLRCVAVAAGLDGYASVEACVAAGLPAWHPTGSTSNDIPASPRG